MCGKQDPYVLDRIDLPGEFASLCLLGLPNQQAALLFAKETHGLVSESTCLGLLSSNLKAATLALIIKTCSIWGSKNMVPVFLAACDPQVHTHLHVFLRPDLGDHVHPPSGMI